MFDHLIETNSELRCTPANTVPVFPFQFLFKKIGIGSIDEAAKSLIRFLSQVSPRDGTSDKLLPLTCFAKLALLLVPALFPELWPPRNFDSLAGNARNDKPIAVPWSIQWLHCAPTSVWSLLVNHAEQPSLSDPYRWIRGLVFTREASQTQESGTILFVLFFRTVAPLKKGKKFGRGRGTS